MELENRTVVIYLNPHGIEDLALLVDVRGELAGLEGLVTATDSFGIWLSLVESLRRVLIVPWHYIRAIEFELEAEASKEARKSIGF